MVFSLVGFYESLSASALSKITALPDQHVTVSGDDIAVPELNQILGALAMSANMAQAQLSSPSLRRMFLEDLALVLGDSSLPVMQAVDEGGTATYEIHRGVGFNDFSRAPIVLERSEKLNALVNNGGNAEDNVVLVWLCDGIPTPRMGGIRTVRATMTGITATYAWTNQAITLSQTLPSGRYALVGAVAKANNLIASRFVFVGGSWRPGMLGKGNLSDKRPSIFRRGQLGVWGEFEFDQLPTVDLLASGATGAVELYLDLLQIRAGRS